MTDGGADRGSNPPCCSAWPKLCGPAWGCGPGCCCCCWTLGSCRGSCPGLGCCLGSRLPGWGCWRGSCGLKGCIGGPEVCCPIGIPYIQSSLPPPQTSANLCACADHAKDLDMHQLQICMQSIRGTQVDKQAISLAWPTLEMMYHGSSQGEFQRLGISTFEHVSAIHPF